MAHRRLLLQAMDTIAQGGTPPGIGDPALCPTIGGPDTVDGIAPAQDWQAWWQEAMHGKRAGAPWQNPAHTADAGPVVTAK